MNNKGFTLVEVLVCVVIIGLIALIAIPNVSNYIRANEIKEYEAVYSNLKSSLELYNTDYKDTLWNSSSTINVSISDLKKVNSSLEVNSNCTVIDLSITRDDSSLSTSYDYNVCIKCKDFYTSSDCD